MSEIKIIQDIKNPLFNRREIIAEIKSEISPKSSEAIEVLSKHFSVSGEHIALKNVLGNFGSKMFDLHANIYSSQKERDAIEKKPKTSKTAEVKK